MITIVLVMTISSCFSTLIKLDNITSEPLAFPTACPYNWKTSFKFGENVLIISGKILCSYFTQNRYNESDERTGLISPCSTDRMKQGRIMTYKTSIVVQPTFNYVTSPQCCCFGSAACTWY